MNTNRKDEGSDRRVVQSVHIHNIKTQSINSSSRLLISRIARRRFSAIMAASNSRYLRSASMNPPTMIGHMPRYLLGGGAKWGRLSSQIAGPISTQAHTHTHTSHKSTRMYGSMSGSRLELDSQPTVQGRIELADAGERQPDSTPGDTADKGAVSCHARRGV